MKKIYLQILFLSITFLFSVNACFAQLSGNLMNNISGQSQVTGNSATYDTSVADGSNMFTIIAQIIQVTLALLAVIFLVLIVIAGYNWMMASGEEEKVKKAGSTIRTAIIGLIITLAAYAITYFIFTQIPLGIGAGVGGGGFPSQ